MSDSFADLWSTSAPLPPKPKPQTLSSAASSSSNISKTSSASSSYRPSQPSKPDVFALLSGSGTGSSANYTSSSFSSSTARYGTNTPTPAAASNPASRPISALGGRSNTSTPAPGSTSTSSDAFSDLFSSSKGANGSGSTAGMTLAARLAMEAQQRSGNQSRNGTGSSPNLAEQKPALDAWAGLDSLAGGGGLGVLAGSSGGVKPTVKVTIDDHDDWGLGEFGKASTSTSTSTSTAPRVSRSTSQAAEPTPKAASSRVKTLWDLDEFASPTASSPLQGQGLSRSASSLSQSSQRNKKPQSFQDEHVDSPDADFDFGGREDRVDKERRARTKKTGEDLLWLDNGFSPQAQTKSKSKQDGYLWEGDDDFGASGVQAAQRHSGGGPGSRGHAEEDDLLGMLGKPVDVVRAHVGADAERDLASSPARRVSPSAINTRERSNPGRPASPPPHILGQIVEMGFSVAQARQALAQTKDGQDVQAALESLLGGGDDPGASSSRARERPPEREREPQAHPPPPTRQRSAPKGAKERERERQERLRRDREGDTVLEIQDQADKILAQASEIGLNMFSKASAFWKEGKEKVVKAYEERAAAGLSAEGAGRPGVARADGRPKWMQDAETLRRGGFSDDEDEIPPPVQERRKPARQPQHEPEPQRHQEEEMDLFSDAPVRHPPYQQQQQLPPRPKPRQHSFSGSTAPSSAPRAPSIPIRNRNLPSASPSALASALKHKTTGTDQFKLGQFGTAVEAYSSAISSLPPGHLLLVPLYTNRAIARIRTGEYPGAVEDAAGALVIIVAGESAAATNGADPTAMFDPAAATANASVDAKGWSPATEAPALLSAASQKANQAGWAHAQGVGVDLSDGYVKALRRRAEAWEGREKWSEALKDWEILSSAAWIGEAVRKEAARGAARCRKLADGGSDGAIVPNGSGGVLGVIPAASSAPKRKPKPAPRPKPAAPEQPSVALESLRALNSQAEADDTLKHQLKDNVDERLASWRTGKETNIRALLGSLDLVLWEEVLSGCRVKGLSDLVSAAQVKKAYMRVVARVHPDKLNPSNSTVEQRMLANGVFGTLNEAWVAFQGGKQ